MGNGFQLRERWRLTDLAFDRWGVVGHVLPYEMADQVLQEDVRTSALQYFREHGIKWWNGPADGRTPGTEPRPSGHLTSSQVACVNHLEPARLDPDVARAVLSNLEAGLTPVRLSDDGYVEYEWIGAANHLREPGSRSRGANVTSLDAVMCGIRSDGTRLLVAFEWKYLESYQGKSRSTSSRGTDRVSIYRPLLEDPDCPIVVEEIEWLFYDPYEQLMRQTLLAWQMVRAGEFGASDWLHVLVVPEENTRLRESTAGAPNLRGSTLARKWRSVLREPDRFLVISPTELVAGTEATGRWQAWRNWLADTYLT